MIGVLLKAGKKEPNGLARCIALSSLGIRAVLFVLFLAFVVYLYKACIHSLLNILKRYMQSLCGE